MRGGRPAPGRGARAGRAALAAAFPSAASPLTLHCFGSSANGLGTADSDLDIHLDLEGYVSPDRTVVSRDRKLELIAGALRAHPDCTDVTPIPNARVPVVKFRERTTGVSCDISFKNMMGIYNSHFIRSCTEYDWRLQPLFITIKYLFKLNNIVGGGGGERLTSYALCLMVIFYLQQLEKPILPPVAETLQYESENSERHINGWIFAFSFTELAPLNKENTMDLEQLLTGFFEYYSTFYYEFIICPYFGTELSRASFKAKALVGLDLWLTCAYPKAAEHFKWCFNNTVVYKRGLQTQSPLCIQDPFELNHNVARNVDSATLGKIKKLCSEAVGICANFQNPKKSRRTNLLHLLDIKIKEDNKYDEYADRHLIPSSRRVEEEEWPQLATANNHQQQQHHGQAGAAGVKSSSNGPRDGGVGGESECKLTTPSNQLLCYFCGQAGSRYDSFIDLRAHLLEKHNKQTRRLCFRPVQVVETVSLRGRQRHTFGFLQNVTCMPEYQDSSQEELRWEHVIVKKRPHASAKK